MLSLFITIIQSIPVSYSDDEYTLTPENLTNSSSLLLYLAYVVPNFYISDNSRGQESFMLAKHLYNRVFNNKHIDSRVIISYINENNCYSTLKNNLRKTVLSVIEQLKLGSKRLLQILAFNIEWIYPTSDIILQMLHLQINLQNSLFNKSSNNKAIFLNIIKVISQVQKEAYSAKHSHIESTLQVINNGPNSEDMNKNLLLLLLM
ncbi:hypothetical protein F8M41_012724 [Gigaspora margarita]|uniref:Uncharacterized protein n=1 Tax=Gigaspora margarita TaxID=4874 RepID=A0A8H3WXL4_GIGMA|nr:hypothetical protein F8M41_012724 [Gigaspora margarita]